MAKTSVYLPDDLAEQARAYSIPVSEVAQRAVREAVRAAQIKESVMTDISAVAERLMATRAAEASAGPAPKARAHGSEWAKRHASAAELEYAVAYGGPREHFLVPTSLMIYELEARHGSGASVPCRPGDPFWADFQAGAREVWDAVQPLLAGSDEATA